MKKRSLSFLSIALFLMIAACGPGNAVLRFAPDKAEITGVLRQNTYLSVMDGDDTEYMNEVYVLYLDKPVEIVSNPKGAGTALPAVKNIDHIEIENGYDFNLQELVSRKVRLIGTITRIEEQQGYHRQLSTPVQIHVEKLTVINE